MFDRVFFLKSNVGHELFIGNNPLADGFYHRVSGTVGRVLDAPTLARLETADEIEISRILGRAATDYIRRNPSIFVKLTIRRIYWFWCLGVANWERLPVGGSTQRLVGCVASFAQASLLVLAGVGLFLGWRYGAETGLPVCLLLSYPIPYYLTHVDTSRYRFPVIPILLIFASYGVSRTIRKLSKRCAT
jgi:hypothetical protein